MKISDLQFRLDWNVEVRIVRSTRRLLRYRFNLSLLFPAGTNLIATAVNYYDRKLPRGIATRSAAMQLPTSRYQFPLVKIAVL